MEKRPLTDEFLVKHLDSIEQDGIDVFTLADATLRGAFVSGTRMVNELRANHGLGIIEILALGQAALAAALLTTTVKGRDRFTLSVNGSGALGGFRVEGSAGGDVRGYVFNPEIRMEEAPASLDLAPFIGSGSLTMTRHAEGRGEPFEGTIELKHGRIAEDLAEYFLVSEQTPTAFSLSVRFDREGRVVGAGGLYLQALPGATDESLSLIERIIASQKPIGDALSRGESRRRIIASFFLFADIDFLGQAPVRFHCGCDRTRFRAFLRGMDKKELSEIIAESPADDDGTRRMTVTCHNCGTVYRFDESLD